MGCGKVELKRIENRVSRHVTFSERRQGLLKNAHELAVLCDVDVGVVVFSERGKLFQYYPDPPASLADVIRRYEAVTNTQLLQQTHRTDDHQQQMNAEIGSNELDTALSNVRARKDELLTNMKDKLQLKINWNGGHDEEGVEEAASNTQLLQQTHRTDDRQNELLMNLKDELQLKRSPQMNGCHYDAATMGEEGTEEEMAPPPPLPPSPLLACLLYVKEKLATSTLLLLQTAVRRRLICIVAVLMMAALALPLAAAVERPLDVTIAAAAPANVSTLAAAPAQMVFSWTDHKGSSRRKTAIIVLATIAGVYTLVMLGIFLFVRRRERRQQRAARAAQEARGRSVTKVSVVPYEPAAAGAETADEQECYICFEDYVQGDEIGVLPCTHRFHAFCIRRWIVDGVSATCPRCREVV